MIFYATALSSYSAKVRIVLCAKGLAFEERLPPGGYHSAEYRAIVPMGTLPAIQIGDWVLSESEAINEYLEESHPNPALLPSDPKARARVRFVSRFHDLHLEPRVRSLFAHAKPAARNAAHVTAQRLEIERRLDQLAGWAQPQPYLLTPELSLADCGLLVTLPLARDVLAACGEPLEIPPSLQVWLDVASQHPAVVQALLPWRHATQHWLQA
jgi:glutathione S-transferase